MSLLLAAALSGPGVSESSDICRPINWPQFAETAVYRPMVTLPSSVYIPPFADTPAAHAQTRRVSRIVYGTSGEISVQGMTEEETAMLRTWAVRMSVCGRGTRSVRHSVPRALGSPAT
jgi:hypothetical protein